MSSFRKMNLNLAIWTLQVFCYFEFLLTSSTFMDEASKNIRLETFTLSDINKLPYSFESCSKVKLNTAYFYFASKTKNFSCFFCYNFHVHISSSSLWWICMKESGLWLIFSYWYWLGITEAEGNKNTCVEEIFCGWSSSR